MLAHFHYTIMGGLVFAFFGGLYYWLPKMTGKTLNKQLGQWHFWTMFIFFNLTFFPLFLVGLLGQPRRVFEYAQNLQVLNDFSSVSAFLLGASFVIFIANFVWSIFIDPKPVPGQPVGLAGARMADADARPVLQLRPDPGRPRRSLPLRPQRHPGGGRSRSQDPRGGGSPARRELRRSRSGRGERRKGLLRPEATDRMTDRTRHRATLCPRSPPGSTRRRRRSSTRCGPQRAPCGPVGVS